MVDMSLVAPRLLDSGKGTVTLSIISIEKKLHCLVVMTFAKISVDSAAGSAHPRAGSRHPWNRRVLELHRGRHRRGSEAGSRLDVANLPAMLQELSGREWLAPLDPNR